MDALAQVEDFFHRPVGDRVDIDGVGELADAVDSAGPLDEFDDRPGQVKVDDDVAVLEVLALAEHIRGHQHPDLILRLGAVGTVLAS